MREILQKGFPKNFWIRRREQRCRCWKPAMDEFEACPYCGSTEFHGRRGGYCRNVECARCGARFNILLFRDYPVVLISTLAGPRTPEAPGKPH